MTRKNRKIPLAFGKVTNKQSVSPADTWNAELSKTGIDSPADDVLNQAGDPEQIKRIVDTGQSVPDNGSDRTVYGSDTSGGNSENTPAESDSDRTVYSPDASQAVDIEKLYPVIYLILKKQIISGDIRPTVRPVTDAVLVFLREKAGQLGMKATGINKPTRQAVALKALTQLEGEGVLARNPDGGVGKPKYVLAGHNPKLGTKEQQLDMHLNGEGGNHV